MTEKYRLVEEFKKCSKPYWHIEEYRWGLLGKRWYYVDNSRADAKWYVEEKFYNLVKESKKMSYKIILITSD